MDVTDIGLGRILDRNRLFLIDTNILFGGYTGKTVIADDLEKLAADIEEHKTSLDLMPQAFDAVRTHTNVRITPAVFREMLRVLGGLHEKHKHHKKYRHYVEAWDRYLRNHRADLVLGEDYWNNGRMARVGKPIQTEFNNRYPTTNELSWEDTSLLVRALESRLYFEGDEKKLDIISADWGVKEGVKIMFDLLEDLPIETCKDLRRVSYQCIKIISRQHGEPYHDDFNSQEYCAQKRRK